MPSTDVHVIDDFNPSISYGGDWAAVGPDSLPSGLNQEINNNTLHFTNSPNATASIRFQATVIGVAAGAIFNNASDAPQIGFVIDDGLASFFQPPNTSYSGNTDIWWVSPLLDSESPHTLDIVFLGGSTFFLDAFATGSKAGAISAGPSANAGVTNIEISEGSHVNIGAVVGGVIVGVALLVGALLACYFYCLRRGRRPYFYSSSSPTDILSSEVKEVTPFTAGSPSSTPATSAYTPAPSTYSIPSALNAPQVLPASPPLVYGSASAYTGASRDPEYAASNAGGSDYQSQFSATRSMTLSIANTSLPPQNTTGLTLGQRKALEAGIRTTPEGSVTQAADSGVRFNPLGEGSSSAIPVDAPPVYTAD